MTEIYQEQDYTTAYAQKKRIFAVFYAALGVYLAAALGLLVWYLFLPHKSPVIIWLKVGEGVIAGLYVVFLFIFCGIKMKRSRKYCKMLNFTKTGIMENNRGEFLRFEDEVQVKDGVDFYCMVLSEWYAKKEEYYERKVLIDMEKPHPDLTAGDAVDYVTQGNILLRYEIAGHSERRDEEDKEQEEQTR